MKEYRKYKDTFPKDWSDDQIQKYCNSLYDFIYNLARELENL